MSRTPPRMTIPTQRVLAVLIADPSAAHYGLEIGENAGLQSGTVHPILARLEAVGWLESEWEDIDPETAGRPRRRYYTVTPHGAEQAVKALQRAEAKSSRLHMRPGYAGGTS